MDTTTTNNPTQKAEFERISRLRQLATAVDEASALLDEAVAAHLRAYMEAYPDVSVKQCMRYVSQDALLPLSTIRNIAMNVGLYTPTTAKTAIINHDTNTL